MDIKAVAFATCERKPRKKVALRRRQLPARPFNRGRGGLIHTGTTSAQHRRVMIAQKRDRTARDVVRDRIHHETWVGAVADIIAQEDVALGPIGSRVLEAG